MSLKRKGWLGVGLSALLAVWLFGGYYVKYDEWTSDTVFFIKKYPTFQVKFQQILYENEDLSNIRRVDNRRRAIIIDYCKYRLGIITDLTTQEDLERCRAL